MKTKIITNDEISDIRISSLPTRPNAPTSLGGKGYTANDMKAAFDRLPLYIIERLNSLIGDVSAEEDGISDEIKTQIKDSHSLKDLFSDIKSGEVLEYTGCFDTTLLQYLVSLREDIDRIAQALNITL